LKQTCYFSFDFEEAAYEKYTLFLISVTWNIALEMQATTTSFAALLTTIRSETDKWE
jgi:hypothetical protein